MATITKPFTFSSGGVIRASEMNANFDAIIAQVNGSIDTANIANEAVTTAKLSTTLQGKITQVDTNTTDIASHTSSLASLTSSLAALDTDLQGQVDDITAGYAERATGSFTRSTSTSTVTLGWQPNFLILRKNTPSGTGVIWVMTIRLGNTTLSELAVERGVSSIDLTTTIAVEFTSTGFVVTSLPTGDDWYYYALR